MAIEIVDFPMKNGESFHSYVSPFTRPGIFDNTLTHPDMDALDSTPEKLKKHGWFGTGRHGHPMDFN